MINKITQESVIRRNKVRSRNSEFRSQETGVGTVEKAFVEGERVLSQRRKDAKGGSGTGRGYYNYMIIKITQESEFSSY